MQISILKKTEAPKLHSQPGGPDVRAITFVMCAASLCHDSTLWVWAFGKPKPRPEDLRSLSEASANLIPGDSGYSLTLAGVTDAQAMAPSFSNLLFSVPSGRGSW